MASNGEWSSESSTRKAMIALKSSVSVGRPHWDVSSARWMTIQPKPITNGIPSLISNSPSAIRPLLLVRALRTHQNTRDCSNPSTMRYPQTFIDDLKRQSDIVRVVQDYVQLKKKGANWMACCPFHKEKTPSFSVSPAKEIFYCFGCHKGGSVFTFVMEIERVAFPEAIKIIADKVGMPLPKMVDDSRFEARRQEADIVIQLNSWAMEWWQQQLESSIEGRIAP